MPLPALAAPPTTPVAPTTVATTTAAPTTTAPTTTATTIEPPTTTTPRPATAAGPAAAVVAATNAERRQAGCPELETDSQITAAAQGHASDMAGNDYFAHDSQDGRTFDERITDAGYPSPGGENIAFGQQTGEEVVRAWMGSPPHRRNILDCSFATIGVGYDGRGDYWVQDFGR